MTVPCCKPEWWGDPARADDRRKVLSEFDVEQLFAVTTQLGARLDSTPIDVDELALLVLQTTSASWLLYLADVLDVDTGVARPSRPVTVGREVVRLAAEYLTGQDAALVDSAIARAKAVRLTEADQAKEA